jgi:glucose-6-phosphate isomerase
MMEFGGTEREPEIRRLYDMREVIYDKGWLAGAENLELYYMYRDLYLSRADRERLMEQNLRYDITIIPPCMLGTEYVKTAGHYHPSAPGGRVSYPEVYEVLEGEALYLLQRRDLSDVAAVHASSGEKVVIPPDYGHVTINWSKRQLKMANFVARDFSSLYDPYREMGGGAYFYTRDGYIRNERYPELPELRRLNAPDSSKLRRMGLAREREIYPLLREPGRLEWLCDPEAHLDLFEGLV